MMLTLILGGAICMLLGMAILWGILLMSGKHSRAEEAEEATHNVPWARVKSLIVYGDSGGQARHHMVPVSRHHIAESGLTCPVCGEVAAERADFARVQRMRINGTENEVIECKGTREVEDGRMVSCDTFLAASPDTEHGDHLDDDGNVVTNGDDDPPEFYRFVRKAKTAALQEQYDAEILHDGDGDGLMIANDPTRKTNKHDILVGEELRVAKQTEVERLSAVAKAAEALVNVALEPKAKPSDEDSDTTQRIVNPRLAETQKLPTLSDPTK